METTQIAILVGGLAYCIVAVGVFAGSEDDLKIGRYIAAAFWPIVALLRLGIIIGRPAE